MHTTRSLLRAGREPREGFAAMHQRHAERLAWWAELHLGAALRTALSPEDLTQEVWARAYAGFAGFDRERGDFRAWLFGIAYNVLREALRNLRLRPTAAASLDALQGAEPSDGATSVPSTLDHQDRRRALTAALANLTDEERRLIAWRGAEDLPLREIAARLRISPAAAESRWRRLLERLRQTLPRAVWADWLADELAEP